MIVLQIIAVIIALCALLAFCVILAVIDMKVKECSGCTFKGFGCAFYNEDLDMNLLKCTECPMWKGR